MTKWHYCTGCFDSLKSDEFFSSLKSLGELGWELVYFGKVPGIRMRRQWFAIFKRPVIGELNSFTHFNSHYGFDVGWHGWNSTLTCN
jgi:hypothetical protein